MTTQETSVKARFVVNECTQRKLTKKLYVVSIVCLVVGTLGLLAYLGVGVGYYAVTDTELQGWDAMLVFALPFGFGFIFYLTLRKQYKQLAERGESLILYEFFSDCLMLRDFRLGEQTAAVKWEYSRVVKAKFKGKTLFIYPIKMISYPVECEGLSPAEQNTLKKLFGLPYEGETLELSACPAGAGTMLREVTGQSAELFGGEDIFNLSPESSAPSGGEGEGAVNRSDEDKMS